MPTISEIKFEEFCTRNSITCNRICEGISSTPDYDIEVNGVRIIAEVKQFDPNPSEVAAAEELQREGSSAYSLTPGERVRRAINDAGPQIKARSAGQLPSLLVLYNNVICGSHTESYSIKVAMFGFETHLLSVPKGFEHPPRLAGKIFGKRKKMTPTCNTSISAIAVLPQEGVSYLPELAVYHNPFAAIPFSPSALMGISGVVQLAMPDHPDNGFDNWCSILPDGTLQPLE